MDDKVFEDMFKEYAARYEKAVEGDAYDITLAGTTHNEHMSFRLIDNLLPAFLDKHLRGRTSTLFDLTLVKKEGGLVLSASKSPPSRIVRQPQ